MNILFYGNCQMSALKKVIGLNGKYICCYNTTIIEKDFNIILKSCDIIFTQMIKDNYHNKFFLSTSNIIKQKNKNCKLFICGNNYMRFYYFDSFISKSLLNPNPYHYYSIIKYRSNIEFLTNNIINNIHFKNKEYLNEIANNDIEELFKRENVIKKKYYGKNIFYIFTSDFIKNNYKKELLFYTINHPTKSIFLYMANEIKKIIEIKINYNIDPLKSNIKQILYKSIEKIVKFNINNYINYDLNQYIKSYINLYNDKNIKDCLNGEYESR